MSPVLREASKTEEQRWCVFRLQGGRLVDLHQEADQMTTGDAELQCRPAPVPAVPREGREHFLALHHVDLAAQSARRVDLRGRAGARVEDREEARPVQELLTSRAEEDGLDLVLQLADVAEPR